MGKNKLITFSGADCCGKSTQIALLKEYLDKKNIRYESVWTRGGFTPGIEFLKSLVRRGKKLSDEQKIAQSEKIHKNNRKSRLLFQLAIMDICLYYGVVIRFKLMKNTVICDRYMWDGLVDFIIRYPELDVEKSITWKMFSKICKKPDVSLVFDVSPQVALERGELKHEKNAENLEQRIYKNKLYREKMEQNKWMYVMDSQRPVDEIHTDVISVVEKVFM